MPYSPKQLRTVPMNFNPIQTGGGGNTPRQIQSLITLGHLQLKQPNLRTFPKIYQGKRCLVSKLVKSTGVAMVTLFLKPYFAKK